MAAPLLALAPVLGPLLGQVLDKVIPNKAAREEARAQLEQALANADAEAMRAQASINAVEAGHASVFVAGWRPAIGWICGAGLMWQFVLGPLASWAALASGLPPPPALDVEALMVLATSMLGVAGLRTYERARGVARGA